MEAVYYAARGNLRRLLQVHPTWTRAQLAPATGMSLGWVDKWKKRLLSVLPRIKRSCEVSRVPLIIPILGWTR